MRALTAMADRVAPHHPSDRLDPEIRERLAALGYAGGAGPVGSAGSGTARSQGHDRRLAKAHPGQRAPGRGPGAEALAVILAAAKESPSDRSVLHAQGKIFLRLGRLPEAERALEAFREIRPKADVSLLLAQILILDGRYEKAAALLDEAEALDAKHGGVFIARGDMQARQGRPGGGAPELREGPGGRSYRAANLAAARLAALDKKKTP